MALGAALAAAGHHRRGPDDDRHRRPAAHDRDLIERARDALYDHALEDDVRDPAYLRLVDELDAWIRDDDLATTAETRPPSPEELALEAGADEVMSEAELKRRIRDLETPPVDVGPLGGDPMHPSRRW